MLCRWRLLLKMAHTEPKRVEGLGFLEDRRRGGIHGTFVVWNRRELVVIDEWLRLFLVASRISKDRRCVPTSIRVSVTRSGPITRQGPLHRGWIAHWRGARGDANGAERIFFSAPNAARCAIDRLPLASKSLLLVYRGRK